MNFHDFADSRQKAVWGPKRVVAIAALLLVGLAPNAMAAGRHAHQARKAVAGRPNSHVKAYKLDNELTFRAAKNANKKTRVIVELVPGAQVPPQFQSFVKRNGRLGIINGVVLDLPDRQLKTLAAHPTTFRIHYDRPAAMFNYRTSLTVGTKVVRDTLGLTGAGVGVAVIDSGIANWHDDLTNNSSTLYPYGNQRVAKFVDFVNGNGTPYDDYGHGTHVAGIIAGNGYDSNGQKTGAAPDASLISLKVLDGDGNGTISSIIAALDWVLQNHTAYNIRVVNMSVGAAIHESAWTDPLTLAAKRVVDAGVVVVGAAGNFGKNTAGLPQYGGISAPGNAPWVLTVGGSSTQGTASRTDDVIGSFSSRGPTYIDWAAKPDLVAPGTGTVSLASLGSKFNQTRAGSLLPGSVPTADLPYLSLTGTSMAAPVVAGTVALMIQANPNLTPNAVKAILQYTAQKYPNYNGLTQGAGFLNAVGAVRLARFYATAQPGDKVPVQKMWSRNVIWGNHLLGHGLIDPNANAFALGTNWGVAQTAGGDNIVWGTAADGDNIVWGTADSGDNIVWGTSASGDNIVWGTADSGDNIVWGTDCGGADCDNIVWGTADTGDNIVWGTADSGDNIVWGTAGLDGDNIVWGTSGGDNIVWGTADGGDNIVWGTDDGDNIVWGTDDGDNIVWGTDDGDNIVWGTSDGDNNVWGTSGQVSDVWVSSTTDGTQTHLSGADVFDRLKDRQLLKLLEYAPPPVAPPPPPADPPPPPAQPTVTTTTTTDTDPVTGVTTTVTVTTTTSVPDPATGVSTTTVTTTTATTDPATGVTTTSVVTVTA
jgi:serine protease AprX